MREVPLCGFQNAVLPDPDQHVFRYEENFRFLTERFHFLFGRPLDFDEMVDQGIVMVGDADQVAAQIQRQQEAIGFGRLACIFNFGNLPHAAVLASMQRFAEQVMPRWQNANGRSKA
ncbi:MAG: hypothetical protein K6T26_04290 [Alicyclobacillus sp.]|nr:hypothetical protein [Alicyclobacillus sp.]